MNFTPVALFVYNRLDCLQQTWNALKKNEGAAQSTIFVFSDGPKNESDCIKVQQLRDYLHKNTAGFQNVIFYEQDKNQGLAKSIISGVTEICKNFDRVIVLEDDIVTSPAFLSFMNEALEVYKGKKEIASVCGYLPPVFRERKKENSCIFLPGTECWGWGTWSDRWANFEQDGRLLLQQLKQNRKIRIFNFNSSFISSNTSLLKNQIQGKVSSWAIRWHANAILKEQRTVFPSYTLVCNAGLGNGTNCRLSQDFFNSELWRGKVILNDNIQIQKKNIRQIKWFYLKTHFLMLCLAFLNLFISQGRKIWKAK